MQWPDGFMWGTGASSTQSEGAAPASDYLLREQEGKAPVSGTGIDFATRYAEDFATYKSLGLTHHRLSIEWARIEPEEGVHDPAALGHYRDMLQAALDTGVTPWVCLLHFSLPQWFAAKGAFTVAENRTEYWRRHVEFMADAFGDIVGGWKPVNETNYFGLITGRDTAMSLDEVATAMRQVDPEIHLATCEAAAILKQGDKPVASVYGLTGAIPADDHPASIEAADAFYRWSWNAGLHLHRDGILRTPNGDIERPDLKDCFDLIGFSYYTCLGFKEGVAIPYPEDEPVSPLGYGIWADGLGVVLDRLAAEVPNTPLLIDEYGIGTDDDAQRSAYLQRGLEVANDAIGRGIDLRGFFHWTGVDNYEWSHGYDVRFGIIDRDRNIKPSARVLAAEALGR